MSGQLKRAGCTGTRDRLPKELQDKLWSENLKVRILQRNTGLDRRIVTHFGEIPSENLIWADFDRNRDQ
jgi:hypothetical protein